MSWERIDDAQLYADDDQSAEHCQGLPRIRDRHSDVTVPSLHVVQSQRSCKYPPIAVLLQ